MDSSGIEKEGYMLSVPCITLQENTEWVETLEGGCNVLVGVDRRKIINPVNTLVVKNKPKCIFDKSVCINIISHLKRVEAACKYGDIQ